MSTQMKGRIAYRLHRTADADIARPARNRKANIIGPPKPNDGVEADNQLRECAGRVRPGDRLIQADDLQFVIRRWSTGVLQAERVRCVRARYREGGTVQQNLQAHVCRGKQIDSTREADGPVGLSVERLSSMTHIVAVQQKRWRV